MRTAFEHEGDIRGVDILAALVGLWREGASGSLQFSRQGATAGFEISGGEVLASSSSDLRFETAAILVRAGKLDSRTLERLAAPEGADRALLALQAGVLTRREWRWGEKIRAVEILSDLLTWLEGQYWFLRKNGDERENSESRLPIPRLILELFLRSRDRSLVVKHLGGTDVPLVRASHFDAEFATFGLTADAESVVRLIDGTTSAEEIAREAPAEAFAVEKLLAALVTLGLVHPEFAGEAAAPTGAAAIGAAGSADAEEEPEARLEIEPPADRSAEEAAAEETEAPADFEEEIVESDEVETEEMPAEGPTELDEEPEWRGEAGAPSEEGGGEAPHEVEPDLEMVSLAAGGAAEGETEVAELDEDGAGRLAGMEAPLDAGTGIGGSERPERRPVSPLLWVLAALLLTVGVVLLLRGRSATSRTGETPGAAAAPSALPESTVAPAPTGPTAETSPAAAPAAAAAAATAVPTAPPAPAPKARPTAPAAAKAAPAAPSSGRDASRQHWLDRAARDGQRLAGDRRTRYAIQLELVCEVSSLVDAFQHDRGGNMWVLATPYQDRTCFRVLWGRYSTIEAAHRGLSGTPRFFSTPKNRPAVTGVR